jgi:hypothetical protein
MGGTVRRSIPFFILPTSLSGGGAMDAQRPTSEIQQRDRKEKLTELKRLRGDAVYEIQLRQDEMKEMETTASPTAGKSGNVSKPGTVGFSDERLERHDGLKEEIIKLKVKVHDLDLQIEDLAQP